MKPKIILFLISIFFYACQSNPGENKIDAPGNDSSSNISASSINRDTTGIIQYQADSEKATYFIVIADTAMNYYRLHDKMIQLNKTLHLAIDTMGRHYDQKKDLIALPENDEDIMYAGRYFQRRFPSESLSLEYLSCYTKNAGEKTIALMTGIYETQKTADSVLQIIKEKEVKSFVIKSKIYLGDIH